LVGLWDFIIHDQDAFDLAVFLAGVLVVVAIRSGCRRLAIAGQQRLDRWESLVEPKEWPKLEGELGASRLRVITTIAQIGGGTALLIGIYFTYQNLKATREGQIIDRDGQITERFIRAVDQLGATNKDDKPAREIRLGGIYGLRRIAQDSSEDYRPVREILNDYVRLNAPRPSEDGSGGKPGQQPQSASVGGAEVHPEADIQAALDFLGKPIEKWEKVTHTQIMLPDTDLRGADLHDAHLEGADLARANLERSYLLAADLARANLAHADLVRAELDGAQLVNADLAGAHLDGADLKGAHLDDADLKRTDFSKALGLSQQQIDSADGSRYTILPVGIMRPESWKALVVF
jgi:hypothetical protein